MDQNLSLCATDAFWLAKPVPRYTSYPPAPTFHAGVNADVYAQALGRLGATESVSLYLHVPFCHALCLYCGCHTTVTQRADRVSAYLSALKAETKMQAALIGRKQPVSHLHFGGGSPNIVEAEALHDLFAHLRAYFDFRACREIAMELDPRLVTQEQVETLAACGVTRVSLGVQSFDAHVQQAVHREQPYENVTQVCAWLRAAGITSINFDLMYGLPLQSAETIIETARQTLALAPDRVSFFSYAHVPQLKPHQRTLEQYPLPDKYALLDQEDAGRQALLSGGYAAIGMDHFAKVGDPLLKARDEGRLHRNFQGYTDDEAATLIALGASGISQTYRAFYQNEKDIAVYEAQIGEGKLTTVRGIQLSDDDALRADLIEALMCAMQCDLGALCKAHHVDKDMFAEEMLRLQPFIEAGVAKMEGDVLSLATPRRMAVRVLCHLFDRYAGQQKVASKAA